MTHSAVAKAIEKKVPSVPKALASLTAMERELTTAKTYKEIKDIIREASALNVLLGHVAEVKARAEDTVLIASARIGEEIKKVPKATNSGRGQSTTKGKLGGKEATGIPGTSRARLSRLAEHREELKTIARDLRAEGKDATPTAVVRYITQGDKKKRRARRERELADKITVLPDRKCGLIVCDDEWDTKPYSRETGMDRNAANHYPTATDALTAVEMHERTKDRFECAAPDCCLAMWSTVQHLDIAIDLLRLRNFEYVSHYVWGKDKIGLGYWNRNKHEILLIGVRGKVPCPAPGEQWDSLIMAPRAEHSAKPECFLEMLEQYFPNIPRIELNRRGAPRLGWYAWGNEVKEVANEPS